MLIVTFFSGESIHCYTCNSRTNPKCADPVDKNGLEATQCTKSTLEEASESVRKGIENLGNLLGFQGIPEGSDLRLACQKLSLSGKKRFRHVIYCGGGGVLVDCLFAPPRSLLFLS
jgi:hypothetical protein